ncbi:unnamed protein product [Blepharisma stoltei]|uniref:Tumor susceptibility gene 101 protein n=1 Tax=Blepharisma stoltei TaxID=1481888 RepID=A0AAU9JWL7_9CILI|nr:unnamed protein product [Blepharisma stoltei]
MNRHPVDNILLQCNYPIDSRQRIKTDIIAIITKNPQLNPRVIRVVEQNQPTNECSLEGTIPIQYKGVNYNILINCILPLYYPHVAPIIFVVPLERMVVKAGNFVEADGRVKHPLLTSWNIKNSSLGAVLAELSKVFSQECPVFKQSDKKPAVQPQPQYQSAPAPAPTGPAPKPQNYEPTTSIRECNDRLIQLYRTVSLDITRENQELISKKDQLMHHKNELLSLKQNAIEAIKTIKIDLKAQEGAEQKMKSSAQSSEEWDCLSELTPEIPVHQQILLLVSEEQAYEQTLLLLRKLFETRKISADSFVRNMKEMTNKYFLVSRLREKAVKSLIR